MSFGKRFINIVGSGVFVGGLFGCNPNLPQPRNEMSINKSFDGQKLAVFQITEIKMNTNRIAGGRIGKMQPVNTTHITTYKIPEGLYDLFKSGKEPLPENVRKACKFHADPDSGMIGFFVKGTQETNITEVPYREEYVPITKENFDRCIKELQAAVSSNKAEQKQDELFEPPTENERAR